MLTAAAEIGEHHQRAKSLSVEAVKHARLAGALLLSVKAEMPHGAFLPWIKENVTFSERTAQRYMNAAAPTPKPPRLTHTPKPPKPGSKRALTIAALDRVRHRDDVVAHATFVLAELPAAQNLRPEDIDTLRRLRARITILIGMDA